MSDQRLDDLSGRLRAIKHTKVGTQGPPGPPGPPGPIPAHEWQGSKLRWELPDGTWGPFVELRGPRGRDGAGGGFGGSPADILLSLSLQDRQGSGVILALDYGELLTRGDPVYLAADGTAKRADANDATKFPAIGLALAEAAMGSHQVLLTGTYRDDSFAFTVGQLIYLSTSGGLTNTQPAATDDAVQICGLALTATKIAWQPNLGFVTHV